jgi:transcriptional regulator with XRE-family HTH domain
VQEILAANLRRLRIARHLSLSELARGTGMGKATLSGIENGRANPTIETLATLARALRVSLGELLEELPVGDVRIIRAAQAERQSSDGIPGRLLEDEPQGGSLAVSEITLGARELHELDPRPSGSRAHVYVLQGKLIAGPVARHTELGTGDYASFPADVPHLLEAVKNPARALLLTRSPN